jgi:hypothetical protein
VLLTKYNTGDQIKMNETGGARHLYERREVRTCFRWGHLREGDDLEDIGVEQRIILK